MSKDLTTKIKMYKMHELGDCFLLTFAHGSQESHVLIDCGSFRNSNKSAKKFKQITKDIKKHIGEKKIDLVVATHQHNDHMSGFQFAKSDFEKIGIEQVFLSWLDNENDTTALDIAEEHGKVVKKLSHIKGIIKSKNIKELDKVYKALNEVVDERSFDIDNSFTGKATQFLKQVGQKPIAYLCPGQIVSVPNISQDIVRIHVLGPPRDYKEIRSTNPRKGESYDPHLKNITFSINELSDALNENRIDPHFPFNKKYQQSLDEERKIIIKFEKLSNSKRENAEIKQNQQFKDYQNAKRIVAQVDEYEEKKNKWQRIDHDWLNMAERFALHLNSYTNNTSLVLAFELVQSGKVLLFVGDAQAGNWRSWDTIEWKSENPMEMDTLLRNTVFYKVGHHGSHNGTSKKALDRMTNKDLVAFIPVTREDPNLKRENRPWRMPAKNLYNELLKKTEGRIARLDDGKIKHKKNNWKRGSLKETDLFVEYSIKD